MRAKSALDLAVSDTSSAEPPVHVGVLVPWANTVVETELPQLRLGGLVFHYARLVPSSESTALDTTFLDGLRAAVPAAMASLSRIPLTSALLACTSVGFTSATSPCGVVTAFDAVIMALYRLNCDRIVLATPYPESLTEIEATAFAERGVAVTSHTSLGRYDDYADVTGAEINALLGRLPRSALAPADALVLSCTAWPTLNLIAELETNLSLPVVSSNLAMAAHAASLTARGAIPVER